MLSTFFEVSELLERIPQSIYDYLIESVHRPELETIKDLTNIKTEIVYVGDRSRSVCEAAAEYAQSKVLEL